MDKVLVLVTGAGRSGTSSMAGTLHHLGLTVPGPFLGANASNPKGFFESRWSVRFHNDLTRRASVDAVDGRPEALGKVRAAVTPDDRDRLRAFLTRQAADADQVVVKDPRSVWTQQLWREEAEAVGLRTAYLTMLRHPAEVVGSRTTYYGSNFSPDRQRRYAITSVARWVNQSLVCERETRDHRRSFVRYADLVSEWRPVMRAVADQLDITYAGDLGAPSPVDEFIDPGLRRHEVSWETLDLPDDLCRLAEDVWQAMQPLIDQPADPAAAAALDALAGPYAEMASAARAVAHDWIDDARRETRRAVESEVADRSRPVADRLVRDVTARDLVRVVTDRATHRLRRR